MKQSGARLGERAARRGELQTGLAKRAGQGAQRPAGQGRAGRGEAGQDWAALAGGARRDGPGGPWRARRGTG